MQGVIVTVGVALASMNGVHEADGMMRAGDPTETTGLGVPCWGEWAQADLAVGAVYSVTVDPSNTDVVHIGTYSFPWKSADGGNTWICHPWKTNVANPYTDALSIAVDPNDTSVLYVGGNGSHVYKSDDGGLTWTEVSNGLPVDSGLVWRVLVDPANSDVVYLCIGATDLYGAGGVYKSTNGGVSWVAANRGLRITNAWSLALDPADPSVLYAGSWGIHKSIDGGQNWFEVLPNLVAKAIVVDSSGAIYAGMLFGQGVWKSSNGGVSWTPINSGLPPSATVLALSPASNEPSTLYAGTENNGVFKSVDSGENWSPLSTGMEAADSKRVWSLAVNPDNSSVVYAGTIGGGLFRSTDSGAVWSKSHAYTIVTSFAVNPQDPSDIVAGLAGTGLARSFDGGRSWEHLFGDLYITDVFAIAMDPTDPATLYAGTSVGEGVYRSTDGGWEWTRMYNGLTISPFANTWAVVIDPSDPMTLYAAADDHSGVFKSTDGALSWSAMNNGLTDRTMLALSLDPTDPNVLYAGTFSGRLFKTVDGGASWTESGAGLPAAIRSIAVAPSNPAVVYVGTLGAGVYRTDDGGASWFPKNAGLTNLNVSVVVIDPSNPAVVYAGTGLIDPGDAVPNNGNGVYVSDDGGESWTEMSGGLVNRKVLALAVVPGPAYALAAGTDGGGVFMLRPRAGDFDCDGDVDVDDLGVLVAVLVGLDTDPNHVAAADLNGDAAADGDDIQLFVDAMLAP